MESLSETVKNVDANMALKVVVGLLVLYVVYKCFIAKEGFAEEQKRKHKKAHKHHHKRGGAATPHELVEHEREIIINPPHHNPDTRTIMAGSGFIPQKDHIPAWGNNYGLVDDLDDGEGGNMGMHYNLCSPSCCSSQYPTPHKLAKDPLICGREDEFLPSNYMCNNAWQSSGCACIPKKQGKFLYDRGNNA
jgi:hypothetical protein